MSANAPYYQMPPSHFSNTTNRTNALQSRFAPQEGEYDLAASTTVASPHEYIQSPVYTEPTTHQTPAEHTYEESHNFANLLEAASSVATEQATQADTMPDHAVADITSHGGGKRKRLSSSPTHDSAVTEESSSNKRRRIHVPTDPQLHAVDYSTHVNVDSNSVPPSSEHLLNDARAAGVHSAAALFRRTSERTSRKYTRPPMSKLFMSLQLSPEDFLQLQAQAKAYMLDTTHPERQNCVGNRGKGDTDIVKLRLFNCVRDFLNDKAGEQFFGEHVAKPGEMEAIEAARALGEEKVTNQEGRLTWPRDGNKIISLVTPLMRRMVTNERQRQYAIETRKGGAKKGKEGSLEAVAPQVVAGHHYEQQPQLSDDPKLASDHQHSQIASPSIPMVTMQSSVRSREAVLVDRDVAGLKTVSSWSTHSELPSACSVEPYLSHINIFLVLASRDGKPSIKLDERRISAEYPAHLTFYDWHDFLKEVCGLLSQAKSRYPELRQQSMSHGNDHGSNSLRGLAAAANALQSEVSPTELSRPGDSVVQDNNSRPSSEPSSTQGIVSSATILAANVDDSPSYEGPLSAPKMSILSNDTTMGNTKEDVTNDMFPHHVIKTIGTHGWNIIENEQDWYYVLREKAFAVWADGVCNVLVELPNIPLDESVQPR
ncbi:hypothetical protein T440DRAFT_7686 [Plenodomus tracheiphilus IPT5]|uniref:Uncharacterized protein n=1 Tax=Plenodomus tracheiphilus IPT5 TaxID=1408161 RepID=A0A6A7BNM9_9PLEO|nr:hypothetical protein T440DRAFT_7686 [Plenodomus tracheiphilus IPT5]